MPCVNSGVGVDNDVMVSMATLMVKWEKYGGDEGGAR